MQETKIDYVFRDLTDKYSEGAFGDFKGTIQFQLLGEGGGDWLVIINEDSWEVKSGVMDNPDASFLGDVDGFLDIRSGEMEKVGWAFMQGRFNVSGQIGLLWKVFEILREDGGE